MVDNGSVLPWNSSADGRCPSSSSPRQLSLLFLTQASVYALFSFSLAASQHMRSAVSSCHFVASISFCRLFTLPKGRCSSVRYHHVGKLCPSRCAARIFKVTEVRARRPNLPLVHPFRPTHTCHVRTHLLASPHSNFIYILEYTHARKVDARTHM